VKKLLLTILFTLVLSGSAYAIKFNQCYYIAHSESEKDPSLQALITDSFKDDEFEDFYYDVDLSNGLIFRVSILTMEGIVKRAEAQKKLLESLDSSELYDKNRIDKIHKQTFKITFVDENYIIAEIDNSKVAQGNNGPVEIISVTEITLDLKNKIVLSKHLSRIGKFPEDISRWEQQCENSKSSTKDSDIASSGSGFFINNKGYFITNNHVVDGCNQSKITFKEESIDAELIATDQNLDLALLRAKVKPKDFLNLSNDPPEKLQKIYVAGYPFGKGLSDDLKFTQGIISAVKGYADNSNQIQIDAAINSGNSGGPIVDEDGNLVAVAVSGLDKSASEGIGFGIKASSVRNFLDVNDVEYSTPGILNFGMNANKLNSLLEKSAVYTFCN
jgi:hypothetical protein